MDEELVGAEDLEERLIVVIEQVEAAIVSSTESESFASAFQPGVGSSIEDRTGCNGRGCPGDGREVEEIE